MATAVPEWQVRNHGLLLVVDVMMFDISTRYIALFDISRVRLSQTRGAQSSSFLMRERKVDGGRPSSSAAPLLPPITPWQ